LQSVTHVPKLSSREAKYLLERVDSYNSGEVNTLTLVENLNRKFRGTDEITCRNVREFYIHAERERLTLSDFKD